MKNFLRTLAFVLLSQSVVAQGVISGIVTNKKTGEPVAFAHVELLNTYKKAVSTGEGTFQLTGIQPGDYQLQISHVSFRDTIAEIIIKGKKEMHIALTPAITMTGHMTVSAVRATENTPATLTTVEKREIEKINLGQDLPYLINHTPSVVSTSDAGTGIGYTGLRIRGTDMNRINVTINGIPLNDAESHSVYWVDLPDFASSVQSIQIQRGVGTSTNGAAAFGASINIASDNNKKDPYMLASTAAGSFNTMKNSLSFGTGLMKERFSLDGRLSRVYSDGYVDRAFAKLYSVYLSAGYTSKNTNIKVLGWSGKEITYQAWGGVDPEIIDSARTYNPLGMYIDDNGQVQYYDNQVDDYLQSHYQVHLSQQCSDKWNVNAAVHYTRGIGFYEQYKQEQSFDDYQITFPVIGDDTIFSTDLVRRKWLDNHFYGATFSAIFYNKKKVHLTIGSAANRYNGAHYGTLQWMKISGDAQKGDRWYENDGVKTDYNIFSKVNYSLNKIISLYGDLQYRYIQQKMEGIDDDLRDISQEHRFSFFNPKAGVNLQFSDRHRTYLSVAVANREPNRSNFTDAHPEQPLPRPERLYNLEIGHHASWQMLAMQANLFGMYYTDQLVLTGEINDVGDAIMTNVDESFRAGVELALAWKISGYLEWEINATLSKNKILEFTAFVDDWDTWSQQNEYMGTTTIAFSPEAVASSMVSYIPFENAAVRFVSKYVGKQYIDNTASEDRKLDPWLVNDVQLHYRCNSKQFEKVSFNLMFNNIFNTRYVSNAWVYRYYYGGEDYAMKGLYPQAGFNVLGGITIAI